MIETIEWILFSFDFFCMFVQFHSHTGFSFYFFPLGGFLICTLLVVQFSFVVVVDDDDDGVDNTLITLTLV